jgi:hypothetical protein
MLPVKALAAGEGYLAMVFEDGVRIFDPESGHLVQYLTFAEGNVPAPGQPLRAVGGEMPASPVILIAGRHKVWGLLPVPPWQQMRDLLEQRNYVAAEKLAVEGAAKGCTWAEQGRAQSALLQLHGEPEAIFVFWLYIFGTYVVVTSPNQLQIVDFQKHSRC